MIDALIGYAVAAVLAVMGLAAAYMRGKSAERAKRDRAYMETRKRMDQADEENQSDDVGVIREQLRLRGKSGRNL